MRDMGIQGQASWRPPVAPAGLIHLAYRRGDVEDTAGRIYDRLAARYGRERVVRDLFRDLDEMPSDPAAQTYLAGQMERAIAQVIVIGPRWLEGIQRPRDIERTEIAAALRLQLPLIPVLAEGATMPAGAQLPGEIASLTYFNAAQARLDPDFDADMQRLQATIERYAPGLATQPSAMAASASAGPASLARARRRGCSPLRVLATLALVPALLFLLVAIIVSLTASGGASPLATTATPPATATFLPTPFAAGTYFSSMKDGLPDWITGGPCKPESDGLHVVNSNNGCDAPEAANAPNGDISVTARQVSGDTNMPYGLYFREGGFGGQFYIFYITSSGQWSVVKQIYKTASYVVSWRVTSAIHTGLETSNTIEVRIKDAQMIFFVNGQRIGSISDSSIPADGTPSDPGGNTGNGVFGRSGIEIVYTNFSVKPVS